MVRGPHRSRALPAQAVLDLPETGEQLVRSQARSLPASAPLRKELVPAGRRSARSRAMRSPRRCEPGLSAKLGNCRIQDRLPIPLIRPQTDKTDGHGGFSWESQQQESLGGGRPDRDRSPPTVVPCSLRPPKLSSAVILRQLAVLSSQAEFSHGGSRQTKWRDIPT